MYKNETDLRYHHGEDDESYADDRRGNLMFLYPQGCPQGKLLVLLTQTCIFVMFIDEVEIWRGKADHRYAIPCHAMLLVFRTKFQF